MGLKGTLEEKDGRLCIRYESRDDMEPTLRIMYWPVIRYTGNGYGYLPKAGDCVEDVREGTWIASDCVSKKVTGTVFMDSKAQAIHYTKEQIACPKVRNGVETRYRDGAWQKLLKRGWVRA